MSNQVIGPCNSQFATTEAVNHNCFCSDHYPDTFLIMIIINLVTTAQLNKNSAFNLSFNLLEKFKLHTNKICYCYILFLLLLEQNTDYSAIGYAEIFNRMLKWEMN